MIRSTIATLLARSSGVSGFGLSCPGTIKSGIVEILKSKRAASGKEIVPTLSAQLESMRRGGRPVGRLRVSSVAVSEELVPTKTP
jgi:hypothetical protein